MTDSAGASLEALAGSLQDLRLTRRCADCGELNNLTVDLSAPRRPHCPCILHNMTLLHLTAQIYSDHGILSLMLVAPGKLNAGLVDARSIYCIIPLKSILC